MIFRIKHENLPVLILLMLLFFLCLVPEIIIAASEYPIGLFWGLIIFQLFLLAIFFILQATKTVVIFESRTFTAKHLFASKTVNIEEITDLNIERYKRWRKRYYKETRMRLTIFLRSGKCIKLNDSAMSTIAGLQTSFSHELPDEEVELYQLYRAIQAAMY